MEDKSSRIGNYEVVADIANGSFGHVYLVRHWFLQHRLFAMKLLHSTRLRSPRERERFHHEAQFLEMLKHPHILSIHDFGIDQGTPYIVVEYAPGGTLRDLLKQSPQNPLPVPQAITILTQIGNALYYAHQQGIIHHDVKPENILFNAQGEALLADFGIAIMQTAISSRCASAAIGTPLYMAPERFRNYVSRRSDQYSLGCVAYELVTGQPPFLPTENVAMGLKHLREDPVPPTHLNPAVPPHVEQAILQALEKRRINRHSDVFHFIEALQGNFHSQLPGTADDPISQPIVLSAVRKTKEQWLRDGATFRKLKRYDDALIADQLAIRLDPQCAIAYNNKGNTLYCLERYRDALAAYERALYLEPSLAYAYQNKGMTFYKLQRYEEALASFELALQIDSQEASFYYYKGLTLQNLNRVAEAQQAISRAIQLGFRE
ncbi:MAG: hypothetical protein NVS4B7_11260 [Ktedonobacteraceae bacterium]